MLRTNIGYRFMLIQCYREYSEENVLAFKLIDSYSKHPSLPSLLAFCSKYLSPGADLQINLSGSVRRTILDFLSAARQGQWVFGEARVSRAARDITFAEARIHADGRDVLKGSGIFKKAGVKV